MIQPVATDWLYQWVTVGCQEQMHLTPEADLIEHDLDETCVCGPYVEHLGDLDWLYMHASLDGREALEGG